MDPAAHLLAQLRARRDGRAFVDGFGAVSFAVRRDVTHLDADALHDRLAAWTARALARRLPNARATVSFHHARPADEEEAEADLATMWHDVEAVLALDPPVAASDAAAFLEILPEFLALVDRHGRPAGWRVVDHGAAE